MAKRKAAHEDIAEENPTQRRRTRSTAPLEQTQWLRSPSKSRSPQKSPTKKSSAIESLINTSHETSSLKENEAAGSDEGSEVIMVVTPHRGRPKTRPPAPQEIITPARPPKLSTRSKRVSPEVEASDEDALSSNETLSYPDRPPKANILSASPPTTSALHTEPISPRNPSIIPRVLPLHLYSCLNAQKRAILAALNTPFSHRIDGGDEELTTNAIASQQLSDLLVGTTGRSEGNSCLVLGPRGSGKTSLVEQCIASLTEKPIVIRLSGWAQQNDRLAMREIARQLTLQTGDSFLKETDDEVDEADADNSDENPFLDNNLPISLPPPSHLPALISVIPTLSRPTIFVLDAFDLFALHARQSLLYCLLDTVQSCRAGSGNSGTAVIGVTTRVDTVNLLEKRVKSRFSGRMLRTAAPTKLGGWLEIGKQIFKSPAQVEHEEEWVPMWATSVNEFFNDPKVEMAFKETFALLQDTRMFKQIMISLVLRLMPSSPYLKNGLLSNAISCQRCPPRFRFLKDLPYPSICVLIAAMHAQSAGHDTFNFEMLNETFRNQVRASASAPVEVAGGSIGMVKCSREVLKSAFERLVTCNVLAATTASSVNITSEFVKYRCVVCREDVRIAVDAMGHTSLKKWLYKAQ